MILSCGYNLKSGYGSGNQSSCPIVDCMEMGKQYWHWPQKKQKLQYKLESVLRKIDPQRPVSVKRNKYFLVPELSDYSKGTLLFLTV